MHPWISKRRRTFPIRPIFAVIPCRLRRTEVTGRSSRTFNSALKRTPSARTTGQCLFTNDSSLAPTLGLRPTLPGFRPLIEDITHIYHSLTHELGELIVESLGEDPAHFREYFDKDEPYLAASLNHNFSLDVFTREAEAEVIAAYEQFDSKNVGAHIDGPPFIALLINDRPGLQVVAGEGNWVDAPVTCRTAPGDYAVPVIPGSVIVNTGGTLMHLSEGRYSATLHRVNTT